MKSTFYGIYGGLSMKSTIGILLFIFSITCNAQTADLIDRIAGDSENFTPERPKIPIGYFLGKMRLYAAGHLTRAEVAASFDIQAGVEQDQANDIADVIDGKGGLNKIAHVLEVEGIFSALENDEDGTFRIGGDPNAALDKVKIKAILEIP